jgi:PAS domain S-box-containing protein
MPDNVTLPSEESELRIPEPGGSPQGILDTILSNVVQTVGGRAGIVRLWDRNRKRASATSSYGLSQELISQLEPLIDRSLPEMETTVIASLPAVREPQEGTVAGWNVESVNNQVKATMGPLHLVSLPLRREGQLVGMLCLFHPEAAPELLADHPGVTDIIINQVDVFVQNARLLERLWEEKRWLEAVIRSSADGILIVDRECRVLGFNHALSRMTGHPIRDALGRGCRDVLSIRAGRGDDFCAMICPLLHAGVSERPPVTEGILTNHAGHPLPVELTFAVLADHDGTPLGGVISVRDIKARKDAEELQNTFVSVISHELQTPIAIIKGYADLLRDSDKELPSETLREKLGIIGSEADRLSKMVDNLLYASRIQAGGLKLTTEPVALGPMAQHVAQMLSTISSRHTVEAHVTEDLPTVLADYERIEEVLLNLTENAIKYSPHGGRVEIAARATSDEVIVSVTDEGMGISADDRDRLFERFSRLDSRLVSQMKGTGLGLYICKAIVEAHGGRIWAEAAPGSGSRFSFSLPREQRAQLPTLWRKPGS